MSTSPISIIDLRRIMTRAHTPSELMVLNQLLTIRRGSLSRSQIWRYIDYFAAIRCHEWWNVFSDVLRGHYDRYLTSLRSEDRIIGYRLYSFIHDHVDANLATMMRGISLEN